MNIRLITICLFLLGAGHQQVSAQSRDWSPSSRNIIVQPGSTGGTGAFAGTSGTGANIDVIYHKIWWRINPDSSVKYIRGYVQTNFKTIQANVSTITFDLNSVLTIDSVYFRYAKLPAANITRSGNIFTVSLGATLANNFIDSIKVFYQGTPPAVVNAAQGYQVNTSRSAAGLAGNVINTLSESYEDRDWWPCKADMQDKIDSMDISVNVPWCRTGYVGTIQPKDTFGWPQMV